MIQLDVSNAVGFLPEDWLTSRTERLEQARACTDKPTVILARTVKGRGVSFMENDAGWHGKAPNDEQYEKAHAELEAKLNELEGK